MAKEKVEKEEKMKEKMLKIKEVSDNKEQIYKESMKLSYKYG